MKTVRVVTLTCFIAVALKTIGTSAGFQQKYGDYYSQYSPQSYQEAYYTNNPSNGFFENSAINNHFQNIWSRQQDYQQPIYNSDRYSGVFQNRRQQNQESVPLKTQSERVTQILPQQNEENKTPVSNTVNSSKLGNNISDIKKPPETLNNFQLNQQLSTEALQQEKEQNKQTLDQAQSTLVKLHEDILLTQPQTNEAQIRHKREFNAKPPTDSEVYKKNVEWKQSAEQVFSLENRQSLTEKSKKDVKEQSESKIIEEQVSKTVPKSESRSEQMEKQTLSRIKERIESPLEKKHQFENYQSETKQELNQGPQQKTKQDVEVEVNTNQDIENRNIHKVTKEVVKNQSILNSLQNILNEQKKISSNQESELDKVLEETRSSYSDEIFIKSEDYEQSFQPVSESTKTTPAPSMQPSTGLFSEPTQFTYVLVKQVSTDQASIASTEKPSSEQLSSKSIQSNHALNKQILAELSEQLLSEQDTPAPTEQSLTEQSSLEPTCFTQIPFDISTEQSELSPPDQATLATAEQSSTERPSTEQFELEYIESAQTLPQDTIKEIRPQYLSPLIQESSTSAPNPYTIERRGRYDLFKTNGRQEIINAMESVINFKTLIVPDKAKSGGRCYCSCEMNNKPVFISMDPSQISEFP